MRRHAHTHDHSARTSGVSVHIFPQETSILALTVPKLLASLRAQSVSFERTHRIGSTITPSFLKDQLIDLLQQIEFETRTTTPTIHDIKPVLTQSLPTEVGDRRELERIFKLFHTVWQPTDVSSMRATAHGNMYNATYSHAHTPSLYGRLRLTFQTLYSLRMSNCHVSRRESMWRSIAYL